MCAMRQERFDRKPKGVIFHSFVLGMGCTSRVSGCRQTIRRVREHRERLREVWLRVIESLPACGSGTVLPASTRRYGISSASSISVYCRNYWNLRF